MDKSFIGRWCQIAPKKPCQKADNLTASSRPRSGSATGSGNDRQGAELAEMNVEAEGRLTQAVKLQPWSRFVAKTCQAPGPRPRA
jgi:hypothetical protein